MATPDESVGDRYPSNLEIEIDRQRLKNYLCAKALWGWTLSLSFFGMMIGFASAGRALDQVSTPREGVVVATESIATGIGGALLVALLLYSVLSRPQARRYADSLRVTVEGAFLRVRQHTYLLTDRKLHFRAIVDYATSQDFLMRRHGICALQMTTMAGGMAAMISVPGVKDCLRMRDLLSDIDRLRENQ